MRHLIVSREYPPAPYPPGGIGTYVLNISRLLAEAGETVHVIGQQWTGAPNSTEHLLDGRLVIHRVSADAASGVLQRDAGDTPELEAVGPLSRSPFPHQAFAWQAALLAEELVETEGIDIIEAQEWEGPLYFFQLRRALGLGPDRRPPCVVHLHSPSELIFRHNEWPIDQPSYLFMKRFEDYSIGAADAWLCPSRFLATEAEAFYGLPAGAVTTIPLPIGGTRYIEREPDVWQHGSVSFVGRLEPRKGIVEWVDAAVSATTNGSGQHFDFLGSDLQYVPGVSVQTLLERHIPTELRNQFHFRGSLPRSEVLTHLGKVRIAVVPSRWENFPNTCVEAMASGLPVIVSPNGGTREMVEDGHTGWIAPTATPAGLAEALQRALATPPETLAMMGHAASESVRAMCNDSHIVARHLEVRSRIVSGGAERSLHLAPSLPWSRRLPGTDTTSSAKRGSTRAGTAVIISAAVDAATPVSSVAADVSECVATVESQTQLPSVRIIVGLERIARTDAGKSLIARIRAMGWTVLERVLYDDHGLTHGVAHVCENPDLLAILVIDARERLDRTVIETGERALMRHDNVAIVSWWTARTDGSWHVEPCPSLPFQLLRDDVGGAPMFRAEAVAGAGGVRPTVDPAFQLWDLTNAIMGKGWAAITYPECLVRETTRDDLADRLRAHLGGPRARRQMLERVPTTVAAAAIELVLQLELSEARLRRDEHPHSRHVGDSSDDHTTGDEVREALSVLGDAAREATRHPGTAARWLVPRVLRVARRAITALWTDNRRKNGP
jgi:glycogen synthase